MFTRHTPAWIMLGGMSLTCAAGCINAVGFLGVHHQAISHLSGTVTILSTELAARDFAPAWRSLLVIFFFFLGCAISGFVIRQNTLKLGRRYGFVLMFESVCLLAAVHYLNHGLVTGDYLASMACGLQNAMATSYSGAVVRTTHMTGIVTDLGIAVGHLLRGHAVEGRRLRLLGSLLGGFLLGGVLGTFGFHWIGYNTLLFPAVATGLAGTGYSIYKHLQRRKGALPSGV